MFVWLYKHFNYISEANSPPQMSNLQCSVHVEWQKVLFCSKRCFSSFVWWLGFKGELLDPRISIRTQESPCGHHKLHRGFHFCKVRIDRRVAVIREILSFANCSPGPQVKAVLHEVTNSRDAVYSFTTYILAIFLWSVQFTLIYYLKNIKNCSFYFVLKYICKVELHKNTKKVGINHNSSNRACLLKAAVLVFNYIFSICKFN